MRYIEDDWRVRKLFHIYESYFAPLTGRAQREGSAYLFHAFNAVLDYERLRIWQVNEKLQHALNGGSYFMLDGKYLIDLVSAKTFDEVFILQHILQNPALDHYDYKDALIVLNFGGESPGWYPFEPEEDEEDCFDDEDCWGEDDFDDDDDEDV